MEPLRKLVRAVLPRPARAAIHRLISSVSAWRAGIAAGRCMKLELGCGKAPTPGYLHHDRVRHAQFVDFAHDLDRLPWPWRDASCTEILGLDVFEHLHLMPEQWMRECHRILADGGTLRLRVPMFGSPWHVIDPTHVRGFHPQNFDYFIVGREWYKKYGYYYFDFHFRDGTVEIEEHNIVATLVK